MVAVGAIPSTSAVLGNCTPLIIPVQLANAIGDRAAMLLNQIHYWLNVDPRATVRPSDGRRWVKITEAMFMGIFGFWGHNTLRRLIAAEVGAARLLRTQFGGKRSAAWYSLDDAKIEDLLAGNQRRKTAGDAKRLKRKAEFSLLPKLEKPIAENGSNNVSPNLDQTFDPNLAKPIAENGSNLSPKMGGYIDKEDPNTDLKKIPPPPKRRATTPKPETDPADPTWTTETKNKLAEILYSHANAWGNKQLAGMMVRHLKSLRQFGPVTVETLSRFMAAWKMKDFRGKQNQNPTPAQMLQTWLTFTAADPRQLESTPENYEAVQRAWGATVTPTPAAPPAERRPLPPPRNPFEKKVQE